MSEFKFEIVENIGILSENAKGWRKELNLVSWSEREAKYDIREWNPDHTRMSKGVTFTEDEMKILLELLKDELE
ncbi:YdbC family protein [Miniphocaeibacter massiliensis]|uniref:YdbC family protein n=1 Tax=Miniphocaeibacter massiliensis TaxID=2041841 RepID=UPI000C084552|nr:PC4/YdbC family ssDNA-binding protein [Miniphocaeibacter massiliensis]